MAEEKKFHRKSIRLQGANYSEPGAYFITICAAERRNIFGRIDDGRAVLSPLGEIVRGCWVQIPAHFPAANLKEFVVMPNHLHGIIGLTVGARYIVPVEQRTRTPERFQKPVKGSIPTIVRTFKAAVTRGAKKELGMDGDDIWQRNYFERVLRDGKEYVDASRYILENPMRWEWDEENKDRSVEPSRS
jgi:putative transposase